MKNSSQYKTSSSRRKVLMFGGFSLFFPASHSIGMPDADISGITQPEPRNANGFIERAFEMRTHAIELGDQPYGAVVVFDGQVIGQSWSRVVIDRDPTAHAELSAIRDACRRREASNLSGATLYSTSRPCPMCSAAAYWAGIGRLIHGADARDAGAPMLCRT